MTTLRVGVTGIGAWAKGSPNWPALSHVLGGGATDAASPVTRPSPTLLPAAERRRAPDGVAVALQVADEAVTMASGADRATLASVFASAHGDLAIVDYLCATLATDPGLLSPTRFHLSVHNAASGYWSIAAADRAPSIAIAAGEFSCAAGLVEAATMAISERRPVLFVIFDTPGVGLLARAARNTALFGFALVLDARPDAGDHRLTMTVAAAAAGAYDHQTTARPGLETSSPAARAVRLARALKNGSGRLVLPLASELALAITVESRSNAQGTFA